MSDHDSQLIYNIATLTREGRSVYIRFTNIANAGRIVDAPSISVVPRFPVLNSTNARNNSRDLFITIAAPNPWSVGRKFVEMWYYGYDNRFQIQSIWTTTYNS